ncbi:Hypothetical predicted protein, partial [Pelobates cultripes]
MRPFHGRVRDVVMTLKQRDDVMYAHADVGRNPRDCRTGLTGSCSLFRWYQKLAPTLTYIALPCCTSLSLHKDAVLECDPVQTVPHVHTNTTSVCAKATYRSWQHWRQNSVHTNATSVHVNAACHTGDRTLFARTPPLPTHDHTGDRESKGTHGKAKPFKGAPLHQESQQAVKQPSNFWDTHWSSIQSPSGDDYKLSPVTKYLGYFMYSSTLEFS